MPDLPVQNDLTITVIPGSGTVINNPNAGQVVSNYEICDRSGFKLRRNELVEEWTGAMVRPESFERRNAQDFVRGTSDSQRGSPRPEPNDTYIENKYPNGVSANDL